MKSVTVVRRSLVRPGRGPEASDEPMIDSSDSPHPVQSTTRRSTEACIIGGLASESDARGQAWPSHAGNRCLAATRKQPHEPPALC